MYERYNFASYTIEGKSPDISRLIIRSRLGILILTMLAIIITRDSLTPTFTLFLNLPTEL
jgi:hypothetical protein